MRRSCAVTFLLVPLVAAGACGDEWSSAPPTETTVGAVLGGSVTIARREVGKFFNAGGSLCTGVLISRRYFLTAAHCVDHGARVTGGVFHVRIGPGSEHQPFEVNAVYALGGDTDFNRYDVAVGRLLNEVPASLAQPAVIADREPTSGESATLLGYGCNVKDPVTGVGTGSGVRRFKTFDWPPFGVSCPGDSGAPYFAGALTANGEIIATNSASPFDPAEAGLFALPGNLKGRIEALMRSLDDAFGGEQLETNIDRPGGDLPGMPILAGSATNCRDQCVARADCKAFTFVGTTPGTRCWLKSIVPAAFTATSVTSGVVQRGLEIGIDRPGGDFAPFSATSALACRDECSRRSSCRAFSFANGTCFTKAFLPRAVPNENVISGLPSNQGLFDLPGSNLSGMPLTGHTAETCEAECGRLVACTAYTFTINNGSCWLKSGTPQATNCLNCISGFRRSQESNTDRPGADLPGMPIQSLSSTTCETSCIANIDCRAWTFVGASGQCWLKGFVAAPFRLQNTNIVSGVRRGIEINTARTGATVHSEVEIPHPVPEECQKRCDAITACRSWTLFTKMNGSRGEHNQCVLWNQAGGRETSYGAYSGRRRMGSF
jgi:PAN domain-containing protein/trypsin